MFSTDDTIVAIATPPGRGGLGVVRLSGASAVHIAQVLTNRPTPLEPRHATRERVVEPLGDAVLLAVDEVVLTWFAGPHSYTGEDVVEISGHGSPMVLERIVELALRAGARLAAPGEFTFRAYLNGRLDLVQAEAVADLIDAVTPVQARAAMDQLDGTLTAAIGQMDGALFTLIAQCEASLDFPEESFHFIQPGQVKTALEELTQQLEALIASASSGRLLREGRLVVLAGRPNTGKSSLFNVLLGRARAIVTDVPGTTRDILSERIDLAGVPVTLVDTAGIRRSDDPIEREGVNRARGALAAAEMTIVVLDQSVPLTETDQWLLGESRGEPRVIVANKTDRPHAWNPMDAAWSREAVSTSATTSEGIGRLRAMLVQEMLGRDNYRDPPALTNLRHVALVTAARDAVTRAQAALDEGATEELLLVDLHDARHQLEEITGHRTNDDLLQHIFSRFCIGK